MTDERIRELGLQGLVKIDPENESIGKWKTWLNNYRFDHECPDDSYIWLTDVLALMAVNSGNFGVGSVLIDGNGDVVVQGHNEITHTFAVIGMVRWWSWIRLRTLIEMPPNRRLHAVHVP